LSKKYYPINQYIRAVQVRVIDEAGKQVGVMSLAEALKKAAEAKLDLVEVAINAKPPVCRIIDFRKFQYIEAKKAQKDKKAAKKVELKEIRLTPFMAENDFGFRLRRAEEFLKDGNKVRLTVRFQGRAITKKEFGYELIKKASERLMPWGKMEIEPKFIGRQLQSVFAPVKINKKEDKNAKNEN
jgi:translation initiation factor IF-3